MWGRAGEAQRVRVFLSFRQIRGAALIKICSLYFISYGFIFSRCFFFLVLFSGHQISPKLSSPAAPPPPPFCSSL